MTDHPAVDTQQRIIQAALKLFGEVGYARAATRAIAQAAGVNEVTLFRRFGSKKNLLLACMRAFNQEGFAHTFAGQLSGDYAADIHRMARLQVAEVERQFEMLRLMLCEAQAVPELRDVMAQGAAENLSRLAAYFQQQIEAGVVRPELNPRTLAETFSGLFSAQALVAYLLNPAAPAAPSPELVSAMAEVFIRGTQAGR